MKAKSGLLALSFQLFLLSILIFSPSINAQTDSYGFQSPTVSQFERPWAVEAGVSRFDNFTGTTDFFIAAKRQIGRSIYIMGNVTFIGLLNDINYFSQYTPNGRTSVTFVNGTNRVKGSKISMLFVFYPIEDKIINFYVSGGPMFIFCTDNEDQHYYTFGQSSTSQSYSIASDKMWGTGLSANIGIEWKIVGPYSIITEYGMLAILNHSSISQISGRNESRDINQYDYSRNFFQAYVSNLNFGVIVYL